MAFFVENRPEKKTKAHTFFPQRFSITRSIILIISFTLYYFFTGLALVMGKKLSKSYKLPTKDVVDVAFMEVKKKQRSNSSKVVDLDYTPPPINLMKQ